MDYSFLLAKTPHIKLFILKFGRISILSFLFVFGPFLLWGQGCNCPALSGCSPCSGGLTGLTLRFDGSATALITASDQLGDVFSGVIDPGETFSFTGSLVNQKFVGANVELRVDGVLNTLIASACGSTLVGSVYGDFTVSAGTSLSGGALCCSELSMETTPPVISNCPSTISVNLPSNACSMAVSWTIPSATDNCTMGNFSGTHTPGNIFSLGSTEVIYTAIDIYGNTSTCSFMVVVDDPFNPTITGCPSDISVIANSSCEAVVSWTAPTASDNCSVTLSSSHNPGSTFPFGTTLVTYTATDQKGNASTCTFNVTVTNSNDPVITGCPTQIIVDADENGEAIATWDEPQASTLCGAVAITKSHEPGSTFTVGTTSVIYTFTDDTGRSSTCTFDVLVQESDIEFTVSKAVTPDGDGINDIWLLENIENFENNTVVVVDRWGNKIFQATGYDNESIFWDGTNQSGVVVPTGTYFYTIEVRFQGTVVKRKGYLEVIQ